MAGVPGGAEHSESVIALIRRLQDHESGQSMFLLPTNTSLLTNTSS